MAVQTATNTTGKARNTLDFTHQYNCYNPVESIEDFTGRARFITASTTSDSATKQVSTADTSWAAKAQTGVNAVKSALGISTTATASGTTDSELDLIITGADIVVSEHHQIDQHIGESFSLVMFGKEPTTSRVTATLIDAKGGYGKSRLVTLYRDVLRPTAVARTGVMPVLALPRQAIAGPVQALELSADSLKHGVWSVVMQIIVMKYTVIAPDGTTVEFDYTTGEDTPIRRIIATSSDLVTVKLTGSKENEEAEKNGTITAAANEILKGTAKPRIGED